MNKEFVKEYVEKLKTIENELDLLKEDKKQLDADFKDKIDVKAVQAALRILKIKSSCKSSDDEIDEVLSILDL